MNEVSLDQKVKTLLSKMTVDEKIAQLASVEAKRLLDKKFKFAPAAARKYMRDGIGQITRTLGYYCDKDDAHRRAGHMNNEFQRFLVTKTRLGIPAIVHEECLAGIMGMGGTVFPQAIGLGCTFAPEAVRKMTDIIRRQLRGMGCHQGLAPVLDVQRDARWGRTEETLSEDHYLVAAMGAAYIQGLQSGDLRNGVLATVKHFAGHGWSEGGRNLAPAHLTPREFHEIFLFPFEVAVRFAEAWSLMNAYHEVDGIPCASSRELLTEILREKWGFKGIIVSDYAAIPMLHTHHHALASLKAAAVAALEAGLDIELPQKECYAEPLKAALEEGLLAEETINLSVTRMLKVKHLLGLFEQPYVDAKKSAGNFDTFADRRYAGELARKTLVLLTNNGVLPLKNIKKLAVVGPNAAGTINLCGDYHIAAHRNYTRDSVRMVSILEGIRQRAGNRIAVLHAPGCAWNDEERGGFGAAVALARQADAVIALMHDVIPAPGA